MKKLMTSALLTIVFLSLPHAAKAQSLAIDGEVGIKYESRTYNTPGIEDMSFVERTLRLRATAPLSEKTSLFLRLGHQSYSGDKLSPSHTAIDQYGLTWKNTSKTIVLGSQETYLGAYGAMFDNSSNVGEGMFKGIDIRDERGANHYHFTSGSIDAALFDDHRSHSFWGSEWAHFFGDTRFLVSYLHIPNLPKKTDHFSGFSINAPMGKAEFLTEFVQSSASTANQALLVGMNYQPTETQGFKIVTGQLQDNSIPEGKSALGGYDSGIRGYQLTAIQAFSATQRISVKYTDAATITTNIPIQKIEIEYTHQF